MAERAAGGRGKKRPPGARNAKAKPADDEGLRFGVGETSPEALAELRADEDLAELIDGLALSARFHLYLLIAETPRLTGAILDILATDVPKARGEPVRIVHIDPYRGHTPPSAPIPFERLIQEVLARLVDLAPEERDPEVILVVDASRALPQDHDAWVRLFMRMNERRNLIVKQLRGPLLLVLPGWLEPVFAYAAPDVWSIRSLAVVVKAPASLFPAQPARVLEPAPKARPESGPAPEGEAAEIAAGLAEARASLDRDLADASALATLRVWLERQRDHETAYGSLDRGLEAAEEGLEISRRLLSRDPEGAQALRDLSVSLERIGDVHFARGEQESARAAYDESLLLARQLLSRDPEGAQTLRDLSVSLERIGDVHLARGEQESARAAYDESLLLTRRLLSRDAEDAQALRDLSVSLSKLGNVHLARGEQESARAAYDESLLLARRLLSRDPEGAQALRDLSVSLSKLGDVHLVRGEQERARAAYDESLLLARRLLSRDPESAQAMRDLSVILDRIGYVHRARGEPERVLTTYANNARLSPAVQVAESRGRSYEALLPEGQAGAESDARVRDAAVSSADIVVLDTALDASKPKHARPEPVLPAGQGERLARKPTKPKRRPR